MLQYEMINISSSLEMCLLSLLNLVHLLISSINTLTMYFETTNISKLYHIQAFPPGSRRTGIFPGYCLKFALLSLPCPSPASSLFFISLPCPIPASSLLFISLPYPGQVSSLRILEGFWTQKSLKWAFFC